MNKTIEAPPPALTAEQRFEQLIKKLEQAGYDMDEPEYNRLQREFKRGKFN
jgi:hypothetical protein